MTYTTWSCRSSARIRRIDSAGRRFRVHSTTSLLRPPEAEPLEWVGLPAPRFPRDENKEAALPLDDCPTLAALLVLVVVAARPPPAVIHVSSFHSSMRSVMKPLSHCSARSFSRYTALDTFAARSLLITVWSKSICANLWYCGAAAPSLPGGGAYLRVKCSVTYIPARCKMSMTSCTSAPGLKYSELMPVRTSPTRMPASIANSGSVGDF